MPTVTVITGTSSNQVVGTGVGYPEGTKMYLALLTQSGTDAPVATVLVNTLGGTVVWTRDNFGKYTGTLASAFTADKTICFSSIIPNNGGSGDLSVSQIGQLTTSTVGVYTYINGGDNFYYADISANGSPLQIQILVFP